jgi:non-specific serine/threonine protein kinase
VQEVGRVLGAARLVTLTGVGGVGKTRLALRAANNALQSFSDGVWLVQLAPVRDPSLVATAIAQTLGVPSARGETTLESLRAALERRQLLLIVDNVEQVLEGAPIFVRLLEGCPRLKILATSRSVLRVTGEWEFVVPTLRVPPRAVPVSAASVSQYEAGHLFVDRARAAKSDFAVDEHEAETIAEICRRLEGLPLAIELAAALIRTLPPKALLARLGQRLQLLTGGPLDQPIRLRTVRAAITWSYELLRPDEQAFFRSLGVFAGGFTLEAVTAVWSAAHADPARTLDMLASLIDKSLVHLQNDAAEPRYTLLETVREFAIDELSAAQQEDTVRGRHADYFTRLAVQAETQLTGPQQRAWLQVLEAERENLRQALEWLVGRLRSGAGADSGQALSLAGTLSRFWAERGHAYEASRWLDEVLRLSQTPELSQARANALFAAGYLAFRQGELLAACQYHEQSLALYRQLGDRVHSAMALHHIGWSRHYLGDYPAAQRAYGEAYAERTELGDSWGISETLHGLGALAADQGQLEDAKLLLEQSLAIKRTIGEELWSGQTLYFLGVIALDQGDKARAATTLKEALEVGWALGARVGVAYALEALARLALEQGIPRRAVQLLAAAESVREAIHSPVRPNRRAAHEALVAQARAQLDDASARRAAAIGREMSLAAVVDEALTWLDAAGRGEVQRTEARGGLSEREFEILQLLADGRTNQQIAAVLVISPRTVSHHLANIFAKLGVSTRSAATSVALRSGILPDIDQTPVI